MKDFWDERASEDPFFFVDNRRAYRDTELEAFWAGGEESIDVALGRVGAAVIPDDEIVEIGCGVGRLTRVLAARGRSVRAVDVSERMLARAQELNPQLVNVEWHLGDGVSLAGIENNSADVCNSHVVFQHIPNPEITLGYIKEIGRVLRAGGWAAFEVSTAPDVHRPPPPGRRAGAIARALLKRGPKGQAHPAWLGSSVDIADLRSAARDGGTEVERIVGEGTQYCSVLLRKPDQSPP